MPKTIRDPAIINPAIDTLENITGIRRQEASFINGALRNSILDSADLNVTYTRPGGVGGEGKGGGKKGGQKKGEPKQ